MREDGTYTGFEDFAVLNGRQTADKYRGSYETSIFKRLRDFGSVTALNADSERLFKLLVLNCAVRNGDAHLKNFGVLYPSIEGPVSLAPVYDIVTTTAYLPGDRMALTLDGSTQWPSAAVLQRFGETRGIASPSSTRATLEQVAQAVSQTMEDIRTYIRRRPDFALVGGRMLSEWDKGIASLKVN